MRINRILLKISGEALGGPDGTGLDPKVIANVTREIADASIAGTSIAIVMGAGNFFRGMKGAADGMDRVVADQMGMIATVLNAMALSDALNKLDTPSVVLSAIGTEPAVESYAPRKGLHALDSGKIVLCPGGTGNPFFTTDSAAVLRALELKCDVMLKATKVDGVYDKDPVKHPEAEKFDELTYSEVLGRKLGIMDLTAVTLAESNQLPMIVFDMNASGALGRIISCETGLGTVIKS